MKIMSMIEINTNKCKEKGLSEEFIVQFFKAIHQESISHQEKIFNS
jgi:chorismate mutase